MGTQDHQRLPRHRARPRVPARASLGHRRAARRQRIQPGQPARHAQGGQFLIPTTDNSRTPMTVSILRTADAWWGQTPTGAAQATTTASSTRELLADRAAIEAAAHSSDTVPVDSLQLLSPI